jgi:GWxTD domain-containing protein
MRAVQRLAIAIALVATAGAASAQVPARFRAWAGGPAQWLMSSEERSAWRAVRSDAEARQFIELFWARRDPTPGTPRNEYREAIHARIVAADRQFSTSRVRGAMTDAGRVAIVLGAPRDVVGRPESYFGPGASARTVGRHSGAAIQFVYDRPVALGLSGPVSFVENLNSHQFDLDPQRGNVAGALAAAARSAIVNPQLRAVPAWAVTLETE